MNEGNAADWALVCWTAMLAFATIALAIVAVFQDRLRALVSKPKLKLEININSADSQKALLEHRIPVHDSQKEEKFGFQIISHYTYEYDNVYYLRLRVKNYGQISAKNVEVLLTDVIKLDEKEKKWEILPKFSQDNLIWNTFGEGGITKYYWEYISPHTFQYVNLARIIDPKKRIDNNGESIKIPDEEFGYIDSTPDDEVVISLQVFMRSTTRHYLLTKGTYRFKLTIGSSNAKKYETLVELKFNGLWNDNPEIMLRDNIFVNMLS